MPRGGARNRSGPSIDPQSGRSDARGVVLTALPNEGFQGSAPEFPLPSASDREIELWLAVWRTPQAAAWSIQPWRHYVVGQWVRWSVRAEDSEASAAVVAAVIRFADQIGLTPAGLKENGWAIATDEVAAKAAQRGDEDARPKSSRDRMKVAGGGG
jgi:hypothetical protein